MHEESFFADPRSWVAAAFVIFFVIFGAKLWSVVTGILDKRTASVRAELDEASRLRREAEAMLADATKQREVALAEARALLEGAHAEAGRLAAAAADEAASAATRREKMALDRISAAEKAAVDEVRITAADVACVAAGRVIREGLTAEADGALVDHAIAGLAAALSPRRAA
jgi:F-type H+-transporting ATPase subunit b